MKKKLFLSLIIGILISVAALFFAFKNVPFYELSKYIGKINYFWIFPAFLVSIVCLIFRAIRWQIILIPSKKIDFWNAYHPLTIGFMVNCILPGRLGEAVRPAYIKKKNSVPFSTGIATIAAERIFDLIFIILFFVFIVKNIQIDPNLEIKFGNYNLNKETLNSIGWGMLNLLIFIVFTVITISFAKTRNLIKKVIKAFPSIFFFSAFLKNKSNKWISLPFLIIVENIAKGFALVKHPSLIFYCAILSIIIWFLNAASFYLVAFGCPGININFFDMFLVMVIICFFIALPSVPGYWGLWEAGGIFALSLFGINVADAAGFTLVNHVVQIFFLMFTGIISIIATGTNISQISTVDEPNIENL
ncbi:MAG: flippase-like domain-containing protein [Desulfobacterales bacterium]|nr:flippase-like domain-containing protein [Desulfobacterales bacterium]